MMRRKKKQPYLRKSVRNGVTVDPPESLDLDDAFRFVPTKDGYSLTVYIADPDRFIRKGSNADRKAMKRRETNYFHDKHMLPRDVALRRASLRQGGIRHVLAIDVPVTKDLEPLTEKARITRAKFRSSKRYDYDEYGHHVMQDPLAQKLYALCCCLEQRRWGDEGALPSDCPAPTIGSSEVIIRELAILTNTIATNFARKRNIPFIYRAQDRNDLETLLNNDNAVLTNAYHTTELEGHVSLNLSGYSFFTSPIRRYPDIVDHRQIKAVLKGKPLPYTTKDLNVICDHLNKGKVREPVNPSETIEIQIRKREAMERRRFERLLTHFVENPETPQELDEEIAKHVAQNSFACQMRALVACMFQGKVAPNTRQVLYDHLVVCPQAMTNIRQHLEARCADIVTFEEDLASDNEYTLVMRAQDGLEFRISEKLNETSENSYKKEKMLLDLFQQALLPQRKEAERNLGLNGKRNPGQSQRCMSYNKTIKTLDDYFAQKNVVCSVECYRNKSHPRLCEPEAWLDFGTHDVVLLAEEVLGSNKQAQLQTRNLARQFVDNYLDYSQDDEQRQICFQKNGLDVTLETDAETGRPLYCVRNPWVLWSAGLLKTG